MSNFFSTQDMNVWLLPLAITLIAAFHFLGKSRKTAWIPFLFVISTTGLPFYLEATCVSGSRGSSHGFNSEVATHPIVPQIPVILHDPTRIPIDANVGQVLVRGLIFDFDRSPMPITSVQAIVDSGTPATLSGSDPELPNWSFSAKVLPNSPTPLVLDMQLRYERHSWLAQREVRMNKETFPISDFVNLEDGSYAGCLLSHPFETPSGLGLFERRSMSRHHLLVIVEPIAQGDQLIEIPLSQWWESHENALWSLMTTKAASETMPRRRSARDTHWPLVWLFRGVSPLALALFGLSLIVLRGLVSAKWLASTLYVLALSGGVLAIDNWSVQQHIANLDAENSQDQWRAAIRLSSTRTWADTAVCALEESWFQNEDVAFRQAIITGLVRFHPENRRRSTPGRTSILQDLSDDDLLTTTFQALRSRR